MAKQELIIIHMLETHPDQFIRPVDLQMMHMAPRDLEDGQVRYMGKTYEGRDQLPDHEMGGRSIRLLEGRGWDRFGYKGYFHRFGEFELLSPDNGDDFIDNDEMTWGVAGINDIAEHIALSGGYGAQRDSDFFDHFTDGQFLGLQMYLKRRIGKYPHLRVGGHNQFSSKPCPGFNVFELLELYRMKQYAYVE